MYSPVFRAALVNAQIGDKNGIPRTERISLFILEVYHTAQLDFDDGMASFAEQPLKRTRSISQTATKS